MSFDKTFCSSPWFHMRINNSGTYEYCRWKVHDEPTRINFVENIKNRDPLDYFQNTMSSIRTQFLNGEYPEGCHDCCIMEQHNKISGRQKQLLKVGVQEKWFEKTLASSTMRSAFDYSDANGGNTTNTVSDWQIDLGNYCNNACIFCNPESSSRLATEFQQLGLIDQVPPASWCDDSQLLQKFVNTLIQSPNLQYLHFIGGETVITPGFKTILQALVDNNLAHKITIGFTTNLNVWLDPVVELLKQFHQVNLGMSIETMTPVNDYVRWPNKSNKTSELLNRWVTVGKQKGWLIQLRTTPTCLTVHDLPTVYDYAWEHNINVESCNFLYNPACLRISVLPAEQRQVARQNMQNWIDQHAIKDVDLVINGRDPNQARVQVYQDARSYINYLDSTEDESSKLPELVDYLKLLERSRKNSILDYLPQYETLFRSAGY